MVRAAFSLAIVFLATVSNAVDPDDKCIHINKNLDQGSCVQCCHDLHKKDVIGVIACLPRCNDTNPKPAICPTLDLEQCVACCYDITPLDPYTISNCIEDCAKRPESNQTDDKCEVESDTDRCISCCYTVHKPDIVATLVCLTVCTNKYVYCVSQPMKQCIACFYYKEHDDIDGLKRHILTCRKKATAITQSSVHADTHTCLLRKGKKLRTFGNTKERVKIPCKYHAISATRCGNYKVTVTPGNAIEADKDKRYIVKTMYVGVERISDGMKFEGRSDLHIAQKFLDGANHAPFNKKDGALDITDVFDFGPTTEDEKVTLAAKDGSFNITYVLYKADSTWQRKSGFQFDCYSADFEPTDYPDQLCGSGTKHEAATFKADNGFQDRRQATTFYNVFMNQGLAQTDSDCKTTADTMAKKCDGFEYEAAQKCWKIVGKKRFQNCITHNLETPESAMRHCVEYVCSNYTDPNSCHALSDEMDGCSNLVGISETVKAHCAPDLSIKF